MQSSHDKSPQTSTYWTNPADSDGDVHSYRTFGGNYAYFNVFYIVNEFYLFPQVLLYSPTKLPARIADILTVIYTLNRDYFRK